MKPMPFDEMEKYIDILCQQGLVVQETKASGDLKQKAITVTPKGRKYVEQFLKEKPEMFLLLFLDIQTRKVGLNG